MGLAGRVHSYLPGLAIGLHTRIVRITVAVLLWLVLLTSCGGEDDASTKTPAGTRTSVPGAAETTTPPSTATSPAVRQLWEGDRVSLNLPGDCTNLLSLPRLDGVAKLVAEVCSGQKATLLASGQYADEQLRLWRQLDFGDGVSGWIVDGRSDGPDQPVVVWVSSGPGPTDGPYIAAGTAVRVYPPLPQCLPVRSFPSNHPEYSRVVAQLCDATAARAAADIRYRDEGFYWRRVEIGGTEGLAGWVTDGTLTGSQPRTVFDTDQGAPPTSTATPP